MLNLTPSDVRMNVQAHDKADALAYLAQTFASDGLADAEYLAGLSAREAQAPTYLGQGIAIPHGTPDTRSHIRQTGVRVLHIPAGVVWGADGELAYVLVGIAAASDEHLGILQSLTKALNADIAEQLKNARSTDELISLLVGQPKQLYLHENLIKTDVIASDADELYRQAVQPLKDHGLLSQTLGVAPSLNHLGAGLLCAIIDEQTPHVVNTPAVAVAVAHNPVSHHGQQIDALVLIASNETVDTAKLGSVMDTLLTSSFTQVLGGQRVDAIADMLGAARAPDWVSADVVIPMPHGLHARPATELSALAKQATGQIQVTAEHGAYVSAKSLSRLLSLGAGFGQTLTFMAEPDTDAVALLPKLVAAVQAGLGDEIAPVSASTGTPADTDFLTTPIIHGEHHYGIAASGGLAVGRARLLTAARYDYPLYASDPSAQIRLLNAAIEQTKDELKALVQNAHKASLAKIFTAHIALLEDEAVIHGAHDGIYDGLSAAAAWHAHIEQMAKVQSSVSNHLLAERAADLKDIGQKVLAHLTGQSDQHQMNEPFILIKDDLLPSDVAALDPKLVIGIITAHGGTSSHSAIVARALGIPAIVGVGTGVLTLDGAHVLMDGQAGYFVPSPDDALVTECLNKQAQLERLAEQARTRALEPAITSDGRQIEIAVNIGNVNDAAAAIADGAEAVGLLRTELVFMAHHAIPDVQAQVADYTKVFDAMDGRPVVVRTLDVGGDKPLPYLPMPAEDNPFLGVRGIRLSLAKPELLKNQFIALIQASGGRDLRIMFPMIGRLDEWLAARALLDDVLIEHPHPKLQVGMMMEVPSSAIMADVFAPHVDFFSIGTNDLTQYTLAIDRGHPMLSRDADGLHPSVLMLMRTISDAAHAHGKWVGVCGELAGDRLAVPILVGLGIDELSMSSGAIALTKAQIRTLHYADCQKLATDALGCHHASQVRALSQAFIDNLSPIDKDTP